ncbi:MAG: DUF2997 domain-containing protein [Fusobacterium sp.]|nr:DUF2997 domain-containing protein [Fusobacterium sp.]
MAKKQLKIKLLPNGEIQMQTVGVKGKKCLDYVEMLKVLADARIEKQEFTSEYYEQEELAYNNEIEDIQY